MITKKVLKIKQGQQPQKLIPFKSLKIQNPPPTLLKLSEITFLSNSMWQYRKERLNRPTNNEDIAETAKRYVVCE